MINRRLHEDCSVLRQSNVTMIRALAWQIILLSLLGMALLGNSWAQGGTLRFWLHAEPKTFDLLKVEDGCVCFYPLLNWRSSLPTQSPNEIVFGA